MIVCLSVLHLREVRTFAIAALLFFAAHFCAGKERPLPPAPAGVSDLKFSEFFAYPVGDRGLSLTPKLVGLHGKRVRILGYMVRQGEPAPGVFLLAPFPVQTHEDEYGLCDDLPPATLHVFVPVKTGQLVPYTPGLMLLTGTLQVGNRTEKDGRNSFARLLLDVPRSPGKGRATFDKGAQKLIRFPSH